MGRRPTTKAAPKTGQAPPAQGLGARARGGRKQRTPIPMGFVERRETWFPLPQQPHMPAAFDIADVTAFQAMATGRATDIERLSYSLEELMELAASVSQSAI